MDVLSRWLQWSSLPWYPSHSLAPVPMVPFSLTGSHGLPLSHRLQWSSSRAGFHGLPLALAPKVFIAGLLLALWIVQIQKCFYNDKLSCDNYVSGCLILVWLMIIKYAYLYRPLSPECRKYYLRCFDFRRYLLRLVGRVLMHCLFQCRKCQYNYDLYPWLLGSPCF